MDYEKLGFRCGVEVHNRLATKYKLFCSCPARFSVEKPTKIVTRKMRAVSGELGKIDAAVEYEYLRNRLFHYQVFPDAVCAVEEDEEPPHNLNKEALEIVLQVAKLLKAEIPEEVHVMRKTVIDGSNTSGFQRTAIVGMNGVLNTSQGKVRITNICLEEEAAGIVGQKENEIVYRLDRLGIPLIEIGTAVDIKNSAHAKEVAEKLGMIIRSTGKSQRGIGVTRQDINVSIKGGARIEIKGVQELDMIEKIIENEVLRQIEIVKKKESKEETRIAKQDGTTEYTRPLPGSERMYPETDVKPIVITRQMLAKIKTPETWEHKVKKFRTLLPKQMIDQILRSEYLDLFERYYKKYSPLLVANTFTSVLKNLRRSDFETANLTERNFEELFKAVKNKKISKEAVSSVLEALCKNPDISMENAIKKTGLKTLKEEDLRKIIRKMIEKYPLLAKENKFSALMGEIMKEVRGSISGETVAKVLKEEMQK